jgi:cobalt-zinc-cadmium resistance protein CzcA
MKSHGITMQQLFQGLEHSNLNAGGGNIEQGEQQFIIRGVGLLRTPEDNRNVMVWERSGVPVLIGDVAEVTSGHQQRQGMVGMDNQDDIVNGTILMRKGEN